MPSFQLPSGGPYVYQIGYIQNIVSYEAKTSYFRVRPDHVEGSYDDGRPVNFLDTSINNRRNLSYNILDSPAENMPWSGGFTANTPRQAVFILRPPPPGEQPREEPELEVAPAPFSLPASTDSVAADRLSRSLLSSQINPKCASSWHELILTNRDGVTDDLAIPADIIHWDSPQILIKTDLGAGPIGTPQSVLLARASFKISFRLHVVARRLRFAGPIFLNHPPSPPIPRDYRSPILNTVTIASSRVFDLEFEVNIIHNTVSVIERGTTPTTDQLRYNIVPTKLPWIDFGDPQHSVPGSVVTSRSTAGDRPGQINRCHYEGETNTYTYTSTAAPEGNPSRGMRAALTPLLGNGSEIGSIPVSRRMSMFIGTRAGRAGSSRLGQPRYLIPGPARPFISADSSFPGTPTVPQAHIIPVERVSPPNTPVFPLSGCSVVTGVPSWATDFPNELDRQDDLRDRISEKTSQVDAEYRRHPPDTTRHYLLATPEVRARNWPQIYLLNSELAELKRRRVETGLLFPFIRIVYRRVNSDLRFTEDDPPEVYL